MQPLAFTSAPALISTSATAVQPLQRNHNHTWKFSSIALYPGCSHVFNVRPGYKASVSIQCSILCSNIHWITQQLPYKYTHTITIMDKWPCDQENMPWGVYPALWKNQELILSQKSSLYLLNILLYSNVINHLHHGCIVQRSVGFAVLDNYYGTRIQSSQMKNDCLKWALASASRLAPNSRSSLISSVFFVIAAQCRAVLPPFLLSTWNDAAYVHNAIEYMYQYLGCQCPVLIILFMSFKAALQH